MKRYLFTMLFASAITNVFSQTNLFPVNGSVGIGTLSPSYYFHGGNNKVLEIFNDNTSLHSQSHLILSTGSTNDKSSAGTLTWVSKNSSGSQGLAYIASELEGNASVNAAGRLLFATSDGNLVSHRMVIDKVGNVGIGTDAPKDKLSVNGNIRAREIKVEIANWPDYVFTKDYTLPSLKETEKHIKEKGHLPGIPSAAEVKTNGIDVGEMNAKLLKKVEELTLYVIDLNKKSNSQEVMIKKQQASITSQQMEINKLKKNKR